jgi:DNA-binding MarR family transcriptional regulator
MTPMWGILRHRYLNIIRDNVVQVTDDAEGLLAAAGIRRGVTRLAQRLRAERPQEALSTNKIGVLSHLSCYGPSTPGEIAAAQRQHPQSLTRVFAELQLGGRVARTRSERDGRESVLSLTQAGQDALADDMAERDTWLAGALCGLSPAEVGLLELAAGLLERLADQPRAGGSVAENRTA